MGVGPMVAYKLGLPPLRLQVIWLILHAPEEALARADDIAETARGKKQKCQHSQDIQTKRAGIILLLSLCTQLCIVARLALVGLGLALAELCVGHIGVELWRRCHYRPMLSM